jgi:hypothetical protein
VCFSPEGDLVGGCVVTAIGVDAFRHLKGRDNHLLLAGLPLVLGAHQLDESLVWWGLRGDVPHAAGTVATWVYLLVALTVVPVLVPLAVLRIEQERRRRRLVALFGVLGAVVAIILLEAMIRDGVSARQGYLHVAYSIGLRHGVVIIGLYVVATCGALLVSSYKHVRIFGVANVAAVITLALLTASGFASLWCLYAALASGAIALHMRYAKPHRAHPYVLT